MATDVWTVDANLIWTPTSEHYVPYSLDKWYCRLHGSPQLSEMPGVRSFQQTRWHHTWVSLLVRYRGWERCWHLMILDVRVSVHHSTIHKENPTRCNSVSKFYFIFIWSSTCFGRHTANNQEPKIALAASGFEYVEVCWTCSCWTLSGSNNATRMQNQRLLVQF